MQQHPALFESLFKRNIDDPSTRNFLEEITAAHPYFSPAQFYLLQQTAENSIAFDRQAIKTNIFFNNPLWLNFQLRLAKPGMEVQEKIVAAPAEEPATAELPVIEQMNEQEEQKEAVNETMLIKDFTPEVQPEPEFIKEKEPAIEQVVEPEINEPALMEEPEAVIEEPVVEAELKTESVIIGEEMPLSENTGEPELQEEPGPEPLKIELKLPEEKSSPENELLFEPMHLVDYFASQGIKLNEEVQATDKLGKQLKSFTEWLKTMKKVHSAPADEGAQSDKTVEAMAEMSNRENEVITEAMAEVFARQGKTAKATEVYQKLSLLNPAKSAYFAAKIENLKGV